MSGPVLGVVPAVQGLATCLRDAIASADTACRVIVGALGYIEDDDFIMIAAPTESGAGVLMRPAPSDQGHQQSASFDIVTLISTYSATSEVEDLMDRAQELLTLLVLAVRGDPTLGGAVAVADVGDGQFATIGSTEGRAVEIALTVNCEIY